VTLNEEILVADIGNLVFTPVQDANGTGYDSFDFKVHDGTEYSVAANTITVDVAAVQDAPSGADKTVTTDEDTGCTFSAADFGFSDVDAGDSLTKIQITTLGNNGTLTLSGTDVTLNQEILVADIGNLVFTPGQDAHGTGYDSFDFKVHDGTEYSAAGNTITVDVTSVNDAPTGTDGTVTTDEDTPYVLTFADFNFSDVDGDSLDHIQIVATPISGRLQVNGTDVLVGEVITAANINAGELVFTPAPDANGTGCDRFGFKVHDGASYSASDYEIVVDVTSVNDLPQATIDDQGLVAAGQAVTLTSSATDVETQSLSYSWTQLEGADAQLSDADTSSPTFVVPASAAGGQLVFQLEVSDGIATVTEQITVEVASLPLELEDGKDIGSRLIADADLDETDLPAEATLIGTTEDGLALFEVASSSTAMPDKLHPRSVGMIFNSIRWDPGQSASSDTAVLDTEDNDHRRRLRKNVVDDAAEATSVKRVKDVEKRLADEAVHDLPEADQTSEPEDEDDSGSGVRPMAFAAQVWSGIVDFLQSGWGLKQRKG
ncbi:MAG: tandem-95 repeat protein, partial [Planctomycetota bacterium]|jgi:hypothetical protein